MIKTFKENKQNKKSIEQLQTTNKNLEFLISVFNNKINDLELRSKELLIKTNKNPLLNIYYNTLNNLNKSLYKELNLVYCDIKDCYQNVLSNNSKCIDYSVSKKADNLSCVLKENEIKNQELSFTIYKLSQLKDEIMSNLLLTDSARINLYIAQSEKEISKALISLTKNLSNNYRQMEKIAFCKEIINIQPQDDADRYFRNSRNNNHKVINLLYKDEIKDGFNTFTKYNTENIQTNEKEK